MKTPPIRWRDAASDASPELREVMDYACSAEPGEARVEALTAAVLAQLPAAGAPPATAPHAATAGAGTKLIVVSAMAAALGVGAWWIQRDVPARKAPDARVEAPRQELPAPPEQKPAAPEPAPALHVEPRPRVAGKIEAHAPARPRVAAPAAPEELELLHAARLARRRAPSAALSLLRQHERDFPASALREEREALMIELLQYFDAAQAAERLRAFEGQYPQSPYREGLRLGP